MSKIHYKINISYNKMRTIILNSSNVVPNGFNDTYKFDFPQGAITFKDDQIAVESISIYYSWFNITSATTSSQYNNNAFQFVWYSGVATTYNVVLPDGYYEIADINAFLQYFCVQNDLYLIDGSGNFVYFLELQLNPTYYAVQLNAFPIPTSLPGGFSQPVGWPGYPLVATTPQLVVSATNNFGTVIGFNPGTYPTPVSSATSSTLSQRPPQVTPINSLLMTCSLLNNNLSVPNTLIYAFSPINTRFGGLINIQPQQAAFIDIYDGTYNFIQIQFFDQNLNRIYINDPNVVLLLVIGHKERYALM